MVHPSVYLDTLTASSMISEVVLPVTCDVTGPLVVDSSLQFAPVATSPSSSVPVFSTGRLPLIDTDEMEKVERPLVVDPSLVADSYLSPCAEPISTLVNHTTEPFTMSDDGVRLSVVPSHPASLVTCDVTGPLVVEPSLQFALVATGEKETLPSSASSPPNTPH